jgi:hypothetical protein
VTRQKSYRLGPADERDVRWGLSQDVKGDVGIRSSFTAFLNTMNLRSKLERWNPGTPKRVDGRLDLYNFQSQVIDCKGTDHSTLLTYEMSETVMHAGSDYRRVWGSFEEIGDEHLSTLAIRYGRHQVLGGLEAFDDLGALVLFTTSAIRCHKRESGIARDDRGIVGSVQALSHRIRHPNEADCVDAVLADVDAEIANAIYTEADARLSGACRAYVQAAKQVRSQQRVEFVARRGRVR